MRLTPQQQQGAPEEPQRLLLPPQALGCCVLLSAVTSLQRLLLQLRLAWAHQPSQVLQGLKQRKQKVQGQRQQQQQEQEEKKMQLWESLHLVMSAWGRRATFLRQRLPMQPALQLPLHVGLQRWPHRQVSRSSRLLQLLLLPPLV